MEDIRIDQINIGGLDIPDVTVVDNLNYTSPPIPVAPPVTVNIGVPVVDIPGCVEAHEANNKSNSVGGDDERGLVTYCDSGIPSYNPIQFEPDQMIMTYPAGVDTRTPEKPETPEKTMDPKQAELHKMYMDLKANNCHFSTDGKKGNPAAGVWARAKKRDKKAKANRTTHGMGSPDFYVFAALIVTLFAGPKLPPERRGCRAPPEQASSGRT